MRSKDIVFLIILLFFSLLIDTAGAFRFGIYFTVLITAFVMTKFPFKEEIFVSVLVGIIMDTIFSNYIGIITLIFTIGATIALILRTYYKVKDILLFYGLSYAITILMLIRTRFTGLGKYTIGIAVIGLPLYIILDKIFQPQKNAYE